MFLQSKVLDNNVISMVQGIATSQGIDIDILKDAEQTNCSKIFLPV